MSSEESLKNYLLKPNRRRLEKVVREYYRFVWQIAFRAAGDPEDASDICQDVFLRLLVKPPSAGTVTTAKGYLSWRVLNSYSHMRRAAKRRARRELEYAQRYAEKDVPAEDVEALLEAIGELPEDLQATIELRYLTSLPAHEISDILGISEQAVRQRLQKARDVLKRRLAPLGIGMAVLSFRALRAGVEAPPLDLLTSLLQITRLGPALGATVGTGGSGTSTVVLKGLVMSAKKVTIATVASLTILAGMGALLLLIPEKDSGSGDTRRVDSSDSNAVRQKVAVVPSVDADPALDDNPRTSDGVVEVVPQPSLSGRVVSEDGKGVPEAQVLVLDRFKWEAMFHRLEARVWNARGHPESTLRELIAECQNHVRGQPRTTCEADGTYRFFGLPDGEYRILAGHSGHMPNGHGVVAVDSGVSATHDIRLGAASSLSGRVIDDKGHPVAGASITAVPSRDRTLRGDEKKRAFLERWRSGLFAVRDLALKSEPDGRFTLPGLEPRPYDLTARTAIHATTQLLYVQAGSRDVELLLSVGLTVRGHVVDARGSALADVTVTLEKEPEEKPPPSQLAMAEVEVFSASAAQNQENALVARTDLLGKFEFTGLSSGRFALRVETETHPLISKEVVLDASPVDLGDLVLDDGLRIVGRVLDSQGVAVAGAFVWVEEPRKRGITTWGQPYAFPDVLADSRTGRDGRFEIEGLSAGAYTVHASSARLIGSESPPVEAGVEQEVEIQLRDGVTLEGLVLDGLEGSPLGNAEVSLARGRDFEPVPEKTVLTRTDGSFRLEGLEPGEVPLSVTHSRYPGIRVEVRSQDVLQFAEIEMLPSVWVSGRVVDDGGAAVSGARIEVDPGGSMRGYMLRFTAPEKRISRSSDDGSFWIAIPVYLARAQSKFDLLATHSLLGVGRLSLQGEQQDGMAVEIVIERPRILTGKVVDLDGRPIRGASVRATGQAKEKVAYSDGEGIYRLERLEPGSYKVEATANGYSLTRDHDVAVEKSTTTHDIVLDPGRSLVGKVVDSSGRPVGGATVYAMETVEADYGKDFNAAGRRRERQHGSNALVSGQTVEDGSYVLGPVPREDVLLFASAPGFDSSDLHLVRSGREPDDLVLVAFAHLTGVVTDADTDVVIPGFEVWIQRGNQRGSWGSGVPLPRTFNVPDGEFVFEDLLPNDYVVGVKAPGYRLWGGEIRLESGEIGTLAAKLERGHFVMGRVVDTVSGAPVLGARIIVRARSRESVEKEVGILGGNSVRSSADGSFTLSGLEEGTLDVTAFHPEYRAESPRKTISLIEGAEEFIEFRMIPAGKLRGRVEFPPHRRWSFQKRVVLKRVGEAPLGGIETPRPAAAGAGRTGARSEPWGRVDPSSDEFLVRGVVPGRYSVVFEERVLASAPGTEPPTRRAFSGSGSTLQQPLGEVTIEAGKIATLDAVVGTGFPVKDFESVKYPPAVSASR